MLDLLFADEALIFTGALGLMLLVGIVQAVGLGDFVDGLDTDADLGDADTDLAGGAANGLLALFGLGRLPLLMLVVIFLALFGLIGLAGEQFWQSLTGGLLTPWIAAPVAAVTAWPLTGLIARPLSHIMPHDETSAVSVDTLVGRFAHIQIGQAKVGSPARAEVKDIYGLNHYVMVEPDADGQVLHSDEEILLVRREGNLFKAISQGTRHLPRLD